MTIRDSITKIFSVHQLCQIVKKPVLFNQLTLLIDWEKFINFSRRQSFRSYRFLNNLHFDLNINSFVLFVLVYLSLLYFSLHKLYRKGTFMYISFYRTSLIIVNIKHCKELFLLPQRTDRNTCFNMALCNHVQHKACTEMSCGDGCLLPIKIIQNVRTTYTDADDWNDMNITMFILPALSHLVFVTELMQMVWE
jgi:hypothetical protein